MRAEAARRGTEARGRGGLTPGWLIGVLLLILGIGLGIFYGWMVNPVVLTDTDPSDLRQEWQEAWVLMTAQSLAQTGDQVTARQRLETFSDEQLSPVLNGLIAAAPDQQTRQQLIQLAQVRDIPITGIEPVAPGPPAPAARSPLRLLLLMCGTLLVLLLLAGAVLILVTRLQVSRREVGRPTAATRRERAPAMVGPGAGFNRDLGAEPAAVTEAPPSIIDEEEEERPFREIGFNEAELAPAPAAGRPPTTPHPAAAPLDQFVVRYNLGDRDYDVNFVIEAPNAEFLGECGVAVSEVLDNEALQRVTALEIWLFDKDDIRTVTKVLLSPYAASDEAIRSRLAPKGELVEAREGETVELETVSLRVRAHLREVAYGWEPEYPEKSYFEHMVVELTPMQKSTGGRRTIAF